ncbi:hypothetical protein evm_001148 [Chilo suppressalis]|nr:hypothetical protein evm_001148 [Chilo suppressalis]
MVANYFARNNDFCASKFRNAKTSLALREPHGDDDIGYVQSKPYTIIAIVKETKCTVIGIQCHDCAASTDGCEHSVALLIKGRTMYRAQAESNLWHELRFAKITASKAYEVSRCQRCDGALVGLVMSGKLPNTPAMK